MNTISDIKKIFKKKYHMQDFSIDRTGEKTLEILGVSFLANEATIYAKPNSDYIKAELEWYKSQSTNIRDLPQEKTPKAWQITANNYGEVNSNYGKLIFSDLYHNQFKNVIEELTKNEFTRRASMIYTRPSIWVEYNDNGKNDFICTNSVTYYIRNNKLHCVVQMRSNDAVFGYKNDFAWQSHVLQTVANIIEKEKGNVYWQVQNLHIYEKHFKYILET
jgi:thymidylate synthase